MLAPMILPKTIKAYMRANYRVLSLTPFDFQIGEICQPLLDLYKSRNCASSTFVTAFNPLGIVVPDAENIVAQTKLEKHLVKKEITFIEGTGEDKTAFWPSEKSVLILGVKIEDAKTIGVACNQNAIVWIGGDARPELIILR